MVYGTVSERQRFCFADAEGKLRMELRMTEAGMILRFYDEDRCMAAELLSTSSDLNAALNIVMSISSIEKVQMLPETAWPIHKNGG